MLKFRGETFMDGSKFVQVFSLESFPSRLGNFVVGGIY